MNCKLLRKAKYEVLRVTNKRQYSKGFKVPDKYTKFVITSSLPQPIDGFSLLKVPENERRRDPKWIFTECKLLPNDIVVIDGVDHDTMAVQDWSKHGKLAHYQVRLARRDA